MISSAVVREAKMKWRLDEVQDPVELAHDRPRAFAVGADDNAVRAHEIIDRRTLAQELGVRDDVELSVGPRRADDPLDLVAGADRHRRLGDDDGIAVEAGGDRLGGGVDMGEIGVAVAAAARRSDRDEDGGRVLHRALEVGGKGQPFALRVAGDQRIEARLVDRDFAAAQPCDLALVAVDTDDGKAEFGEAGGADEADVTGTNQNDLHSMFPIRVPFAPARLKASSRACLTTRSRRSSRFRA